MRHYPSDSPEAMTRVVALALLANGAIDPGELEVLKGSSYCFRLRLDPCRFEQIVDEFCDDLLACGKRKPTGQYDLSDECVRSLLGDIKNPALRQLALRPAGTTGKRSTGTPNRASERLVRLVVFAQKSGKRSTWRASTLSSSSACRCWVSS